MTKEHDAITGVYVQLSPGENWMYTCQYRDEAGGYTCGRCGKGALGLEPEVGQGCRVCPAEVVEVRRGVPLPLVRTGIYD